MLIYWRVNFISPGIAGIACRAADSTYGPQIWQAAEKHLGHPILGHGAMGPSNLAGE